MTTGPAYGKPVSFKIGDDKKRDLVSFTSDAPVELIVGNTHGVSGSVTIDDSLDLAKKPLEGTIEVDLNSIDTGIELRNEHMRDNFLETKDPKNGSKAIFKLTSVGAPVVLKDGAKTKLQVTGDFTLHGKTVKKTVPVDVTYMKRCPSKFADCDVIQIRTTFNVPFKDHNIKRPEIVFQKLADTVIVTVAVSAFRNDASAAAPAKATAPEKSTAPAKSAAPSKSATTTTTTKAAPTTTKTK